MLKINFFLIGASLVLILSFLVLSLFFLFMQGEIQNFDERILQSILSLRNEFVTPFMVFITFMGNWQVIAGFSIIIFAKINRDRMVSLLFIFFLSIVVSDAFLNLFKLLINRPRPDIADHLITASGYSFPSGHSLVGSFFYIFSFYVISLFIGGKYKKIAGFTAVIIMILLISFSRLYLGVHWPTDVIAGLILGTALATYTIIHIKDSQKIS
ncbi:MAG: phosphatase PAP2 family protein [Actinomycetota bacterium]